MTSRPRPPLVVTICRIVAVLVVVKALFLFIVGTSREIPELLYGRWPAPIWLELVVAALTLICLWKSGSRGPTGVLANVLPVVFVFSTTLLSPESYTAVFWFRRGGPTEPWGVPRYFTYQYRYKTYEQLVGACVGAVLKDLFLAITLAWFAASLQVRRYFASSDELPRTSSGTEGARHQE